MPKEKNNRIIELPPDLEEKLPEQVRLIRKFYFQLGEEDKKRLDETPAQFNDKSNVINIKNETKFCFECGKKINRTAKFCEYCGIKQPEM